MIVAAAAGSLATQATPTRHLATPWRTRKPAAVVDAIPADAAAWLRASFDWSFGAVWVACARWGIGVETVVAWAEALRCGGARAGLSSRERAWLLAQLSDPEQQPTDVEMAMARASFAWGFIPGEAHRAQAARVAIRSIDDAIALIEARLAKAAAAGESARESGGDLRQMLLADLETLRATLARGERLDADLPTPDTPDTPARDARAHPSYPQREAQCAFCGKPFVSIRYYGKRYADGDGGPQWSRFCGRKCSARARYQSDSHHKAREA